MNTVLDESEQSPQRRVNQVLITGIGLFVVVVSLVPVVAQRYGYPLIGLRVGVLDAAWTGMSVFLALFSLGNYITFKGKQFTWKIVFGAFWTIFGMVVLTIVVIAPDGLATPSGLAARLLVELGGAALGGLLGTYFSPEDTGEGTQFGKIETAVVAAFSSYIVGKENLLDRLPGFITNHPAVIAVFAFPAS